MKFNFNWRKLFISVAIVLIAYPMFFVFFPGHLTHMSLKENWYVFIIMISIDIISFTTSLWYIWSFNDKFVKYLDKRIKWEKTPLKRLAAQLLGIFIIDAIVLIIFMTINVILVWILFPKIFESIYKDETHGLFFQSIFYFGFINILYHSVYISVLFYNRWVKTLLESERLRSENLHSQLHILQSQVNPHFLFNSLNTLTSVIDEDKKTAIEYVQNLANFYRYILQRQTDHLVLLNDELAFVASYIYLQKKRFGDNFNVEIDLGESAKRKYIPTFVIQILLENTIKHNIVSSEKPLYVKIFLDSETNLVLENNLQRKKFVEPSTEHGLQNIKNRYGILSKKNIQVFDAENVFRVVLPLMDERGQYESSDN